MNEKKVTFSWQINIIAFQHIGSIYEGETLFKFAAKKMKNAFPANLNKVQTT